MSLRGAASPPRAPSTRSGLGVLALLGVTAACAAVAPTPAAAGAVPAAQSLVTLRGASIARIAPDSGARRVKTVAALVPLTRLRTVLPVLAMERDTRGRAWLEVRLPGRPNGTTGWVTAAGTARSTTEWHLTVDRAARTLTVHQSGLIVRTFRVIVGARTTPTPSGDFYVEEALALDPAAAGGPYALATSARSEVLQEFNGGPGQIALHGTNHLFDAMGSATSHGCVRLSTRAITWLAGRIGRGVPLRIEG